MATSAADIRNDFCNRLDRLEGVASRVQSISGNQQALSFPDWHLLSEGVFLSAFTGWESFLRSLFVFDLATLSSGVLLKDVKQAGFRYKRSAARLAELLTGHPDAGRFVEWNSIDTIRDRANSLLGSGHRYGNIASARITIVRRAKTVRNAVAHKSDKAWDDFRDLIRKAPYSLTNNQRKGITVGRFLTAHQTGGHSVLVHYLHAFRDSAHDLVP